MKKRYATSWSKITKGDVVIEGEGHSWTYAHSEAQAKRNVWQSKRRDHGGGFFIHDLEAFVDVPQRQAVASRA